MSNVALMPQTLQGTFSFKTNSDWRDPPILFENVQGQAVDLTGITFKMTVRPSVGSPTVTLAMSTDAGGYMINGGVAGTLTIIVPFSVTKYIVPGSYVADLVAEGVDGAGNQFTVNMFATPATVTVNQGITQP